MLSNQFGPRTKILTQMYGEISEPLGIAGRVIIMGVARFHEILGNKKEFLK